VRDPAFLFYSSDFLTGTLLMSDEQVGKYVRLLCLQHQQGHLPEEHMLKICKTHDKDIFNKFVRDEAGFYFNQRLEDEIRKRTEYSESRRNNRKGKTKPKDIHMKNICFSHDKHMENENVNENIDISLSTKKDKRTKYAEFVSMTNDEYSSLVTDLGEDGAKRCVEILDNYKGANGKRYKSDYLAIRNWVVGRYREEKGIGAKAKTNPALKYPQRPVGDPDEGVNWL